MAAIAARFDGEYVTLWTAPRGFREQLATGDHGPDVDCIGARLAQLDGVAAPAPEPALDRRMQELLREFQSASRT